MKKVSKGVFIENSYPGVLLGAVQLSKGVLLIDAPPQPEDGRAWLSTVRELDNSKNRILVNLDSHPDRTLGAGVMESTVIAHKETDKIFKNMSAIFKAQSGETGSDWEECSGLSGIRWMHPHITFTEATDLNWGKHQVLIEHHPGPESGASWVILPHAKVIFVGDAVLANQTPFIANADLGAWIETLDVLLSKKYKGFKVISSRSGVVSEKVIRNQRRLIKDINKRLEKLGKRKSPPEATEKLVAKFVASSETPSKYHDMNTRRLKHGMYQYYNKTYFPSPARKK